VRKRKRKKPRTSPKKPPRGPRKYQRLKAQAAARRRDLSLAGRDIGELPAVRNPARKARAASDFRFFNERYLPILFPMPWSKDHLKVIAKIEQAVLRGGLFALAMPRGSGKTTLAVAACIWAVLYGHVEFVLLIGASMSRAKMLLDSIKIQLETNDLLLEDFPEAIYPIRCLERIVNRCRGQRYQGEPTYIEWTAKYIVLPAIHGSRASSAILRVAGITSAEIRGTSFTRPTDGKTVRPRLAVIDDPQTDASAKSLIQSDTRERLLAGAILGLTGPGKKISGIMPCTIIRQGDVADNLLDRRKNPAWNGERTQMIYRFPDAHKLWQEYGEVRADSLRAGKGIAEATKFYGSNRAAMDAGAEVAWPERFNSDELSGLQHAMNLKLADERSFFAEYQNDPQPEKLDGTDELSETLILSKLNGRPRAEVPIGCNHLTMFIDVQESVLYYLVAGWDDDFSGFLVDYGTFPAQRRAYFTARDVRVTLRSVTKANNLEGWIYAGLAELTRVQLGREWQREDGAMLRIERCLVDANWGRSTDVVYQFCRQSAHAGILLPSHGRFVGASSQPFSDYRKKLGDRVGHNWRMPNVQGKRAVRHVVFDTNHYKSFVAARLAVPMGEKGCLSIFGKNPDEHRLLAEHLTAEYYVRTEARGRVVEEWKSRPSRPENHWWDCAVGAAVAASIQGAVLFGTAGAAAPARQRVSFADMQRRKWAERR
jgi:hypothetical protein